LPVDFYLVFFICLRECLETSIIVSVLLTFLKQSLGAEEDREAYRKLVKQVWLGVALGVIVSVCIGAGFIGAFYGLGKDKFSSSSDIWEGVFSLVASVIITVMGAALLRVNKLQDKWRIKLSQVLTKRNGENETRRARVKLWMEKYSIFMLPFVTVLREGLEAVVFIGGVSLSFPAQSFPLAVITGLLAGAVIGYILYRGGNQASLQVFLIVSTCFLYLVAAGLFSKGVWFLEAHAWNDKAGSGATENGSGAGSYNIQQSVWHVNCCNPLTNGGGGWGIFSGILGWQNSATYGSVISYNIYWIAVSVWFIGLRHQERHGKFKLIDRCLGRWRSQETEWQEQAVFTNPEVVTASGAKTSGP
ncbi:uncharacterized protein N7511_003033, partial [Penicillium nucicola]|uniref:uncharacterized protein n=1 Tax=Penicillium nucicola TaxID=1850975 RepID=UPI0025450F16